jgi:hypothetical protein
MRASIAKGLAAVGLVAITLKASAATPGGDDVVVRVQKAAAGLDVYAALTVAATPAQTWEVLVPGPLFGEAWRPGAIFPTQALWTTTPNGR